jgi:hypothetical protein
MRKKQNISEKYRNKYNSHYPKNKKIHRENREQREHREHFENSDSEIDNSTVEMDMRSDNSDVSNVSNDSYVLQKNRNQYIGELFIFIIIGILFIYLLDFIVSMTLKWKK